MPHEVEIKFLVTDPAALVAKLRVAGFRETTPRTHEMNILYDLPGQPLRARGELVRLRHYGTRWILTHKSQAKPGKHKARIETETEVAEGEPMAGILATLGLRETFRYEKYRSEWSDGLGEVVVDETPIGNVAEIEGAPGWIDAVAAKLGVAERDYITKS
jgi:adenylate cyclase class 2